MLSNISAPHLTNAVRQIDPKLNCTQNSNSDQIQQDMEKHQHQLSNFDQAVESPCSYPALWLRKLH